MTAAQKERAMIVAWLRSQVVKCTCCDSDQIPHEYAQKIEAGEHVAKTESHSETIK